MTVIESWGSRDSSLTRDGGSYQLMGTIVGTDDEQVAFVEWQSFCPFVAKGLVIEKLNVKQEGPLVWRGTADYGPMERQEPEKPKFGEVVFSFETGGGKQKITSAPFVDPQQGYNSEASSAGPPLDNLGKAINFTDDSVEGVEIVVPSLTFEVATRIPGGRLTMSFARTMAGLTSNVNKNKFLDCDAGTLLFEGCSGSYKVGENIDRELKFKFAYSPNKTNIKVGTILVAQKKGWEYLSVHYRKEKEGNFVVMQPYKAWVHKIYEEADFRTYLGFG